MLNGAFVETKKISDILRHIDKDTLAIFDVDNTLIEPASFVGGVPWFDHMFSKISKQGLSKKDVLKKVYNAWVQLQYIISIKPVEDETPAIIDHLHELGIKTMGLTARGFLLANRTSEQLHSVGIALDKNTIHDGVIAFTEHAGFAHGVLSIEPFGNKGERLNELFQKINYSPKKVLFVDDMPHFVEEVADLFVEKQIAFTGVRYGAADNQHELFDPAKADDELKSLVSSLEPTNALSSFIL